MPCLDDPMKLMPVLQICGFPALISMADGKTYDVV